MHHFKSAVDAVQDRAGFRVTDLPDDPAGQAGLEVIRRDGTVAPFQAEKISIALSKAFIGVEGSNSGESARVRELVARLTATVVAALTRRLPSGGSVHIEDIQDQAELALMRAGEHDVARAYVLYREKRAAERTARQATFPAAPARLP